MTQRTQRHHVPAVAAPKPGDPKSSRSLRAAALAVFALSWLLVLAGQVRAQPVLLQDIYPGTASSNPLHFFNGHNFGVFFSANGEPYRTDGTRGGTVLVRDIASGGRNSDPSDFTYTRNGILFVASDLPSGREPWVTDGTGPGTVQLKDINPGAASSDPREFSFSKFLKRRVFSADDGSNGRELWITDGTPAETRLLADIRPGPAGSQPMGFLSMSDDNVLFFADDGQIGHELGGLRAGPYLIKDINPVQGIGSVIAPRPVLVYTGSSPFAFFFAFDGVHGEELWRSDGTTGGTVLVKDINPGSSGSRGLGLGHPVAFDRRCYFSAARPAEGEELWVSDGTQAGTMLVADISPGSSPSLPRELTAIQTAIGRGGILVFSAQEPTGGHELYVVQPGVPGVERHDIEPGPASSGPGGLRAVGNHVYFSATIGGTQHLMRVGSAGIVEVISSQPSNTHSMTGYPGGVILSGLDPLVGQEPYVLDLFFPDMEFPSIYSCGPSATMDATLPALGQSWDFSGSAPPGSLGLVILTPGTGSGTQIMFGGCKIYVSPQSFFVPAGVEPVTGAWRLSLNLPDDVQLEGVQGLLDSVFLTPQLEVSVPPPGSFRLGCCRSRETAAIRS
jgi:ELWxxDGT repeat protein